MSVPEFSIVGTIMEFIFADVPRKKGFLIFGGERVPSATVAAAQVISTSIGLAAGVRWPDRTKPLILIQPGTIIDEVLAKFARRMEAKVAAASSVAPALKMWALAGVEDSMISTDAWYPVKYIHDLCHVSFVSGTAAGINQSGSGAWLMSWATGISNSWDNAREAGLAVEDSAPSYDSLLRSVGDLIALAERDELVDEPSPSWQVFEYLWRFEVARIALLAMGSIQWRDPEQEIYRGILY